MLAWAGWAGHMRRSVKLCGEIHRVTAEGAAEAKSSVEAAVTESREKLRQSIDQAQVDVNLALKDAGQQAGEAADRARSKWAQMKADAAAKMDDVKAKIDKCSEHIDAKAAARDAD